MCRKRKKVQSARKILIRWKFVCQSSSRGETLCKSGSRRTIKKNSRRILPQNLYKNLLEFQVFICNFTLRYLHERFSQQRSTSEVKLTLIWFHYSENVFMFLCCGESSSPFRSSLLISESKASPPETSDIKTTTNFVEELRTFKLEIRLEPGTTLKDFSCLSRIENEF